MFGSTSRRSKIDFEDVEREFGRVFRDFRESDLLKM